MAPHRHRSVPLAAAALIAALAAGATACGGTNATAAPARARTARARPGIPSSAPEPLATEAVVRRAYLRSWDDYARAVWALDPHGLERRYARDGLSDVEVEIERRVTLRRRSRVDVTHDPHVVLLGPDRAAVTDNTIEASVDVDADTGADLETRQPRPRYFQMILERIDGHWKVVFCA